MKHIQMFEDFSYAKGVPASKLANRDYWAMYDYMDGQTAEYWMNDPGYQELAKNLGTSLDRISALNSESDDVEHFENYLEGKQPAKTVRSNQEFIRSWEYFPELGIAVANGDGGSPDWFFVK
jgi:hypothetical protein